MSRISTGSSALRRMGGEVILRILAELVFFLLCRE